VLPSTYCPATSTVVVSLMARTEPSVPEVTALLSAIFVPNCHPPDVIIMVPFMTVVS